MVTTWCGGASGCSAPSWLVASDGTRMALLATVPMGGSGLDDDRVWRNVGVYSSSTYAWSATDGSIAPRRQQCG
ncbi:hypothetical protein E2562_011488 [Oryza meyeriana var. granulata]|uniref:Uncharacterized protein n=1 Tax=Oryza meyeriana var. granulata TaxID=110450 RepID=A0A6G1D279_9ORYZ|nr:hypothetical protein E2562_011488 [Oryza meyeriana var. granulata]